MFTAEAASDLDPIIVTSPTIRSGTTLLQRLLCSSPDALIYGEECGKDLELFLQIYVSKLSFYTHARGSFDASLHRVLDGDVNDWILDLMPDADGYLAALGQACFAGLAYCRDYAARAGRTVWGVKYPGWRPHVISLLRRTLPRARFVVIHRDIAGCLRSAKARGSVTSEQEARAFCNDWRVNLSFMLGMRGDPAALVVSYADLVGEPERTIGVIEGFTGARGMRPEVLQHKINAWVDADGKTANRSGYIAPADLTETETRIADEAASALASAVSGVNAT